MKKKDKILICGLGSIGQRHALNLINLGYDNLILYREKKINKLDHKLRKYLIVNKVSGAIKQKPVIALICNTSDKHLSTAIHLAKNNIHLFIEKPAGIQKNKFKTLIKICRKNKIINMVGYMMRFHPAIAVIKKILDKRENGPFFYFRSEWGEFLPNWHPKENYKKSYAANKKMGGDIGLTLSHDLDLAKFFFGEIQKVIKLNQSNKILKINAESITDYFIYFKKKINGFIHLDYLQKNNSRIWKIVGANNQIFFDYYKNKLTFNKGNKTKIYNFRKFNRNKLFQDEIKYFIKCVKNNRKIDNDVEQSYKLLNDFKLLN